MASSKYNPFDEEFSVDDIDTEDDSMAANIDADAFTDNELPEEDVDNIIYDSESSSEPDTELYTDSDMYSDSDTGDYIAGADDEYVPNYNPDEDLNPYIEDDGEYTEYVAGTYESNPISDSTESSSADETYWDESSPDYDYSTQVYQSPDSVAPDEDDINTGFPTYDPTAEEYDTNLIERTYEDDGWQTWHKVAFGVLGVILAVLVSWFAWWMLDGKDDQQLFPWQTSSTSNNDNAANTDTSEYNVDAIVPTTPGTTSGQEQDDASSSTSSGESTGSSSDASLVAELSARNDQLRSDVTRLQRERDQAANRTVTTTRVDTRTVTAPPRVETRTVTAPPRVETRTVTNNVTQPAPPPRVETRTVTNNVPGPTVTNTVTTTMPGQRIIMTTTVIQRVR